MTPGERARSQALHEAIDRVLKEHADHESDRGVLLSWTVVAEYLGDDGDEYLRMVSNENSVAWRVLGMLEYAAASRRADIYQPDT